MFGHLSRVLLLALTAVLVGAQAAKVEPSEDVLGSVSRSAKIGRQGGYQNAKNSATGVSENTQTNSKPRKYNSNGLSQNSVPEINLGKKYQLSEDRARFPLSSSSDQNNEAALGDDFLDDLFNSETIQPSSTDGDQHKLSENFEEQDQQKESNTSSENRGSVDKAQRDEQYHFLFNYTIDTAGMFLECQDGRVNLEQDVSDLVLTLKWAREIFPRIRANYSQWAYQTSWEDYSHLIKEDLEARYVPLLPQLPEDFNLAVIKSERTTTPSTNFLPRWIQEILSSSTSSPEGRTVVTSLEQVLKDACSVMELLKTAMDSVLLEHALSRSSLLQSLTELNTWIERILGRLWYLLDRCHIDPNIEPLRRILDSSSIYKREDIDDIKRRGFLTIHHTEKAARYVLHILKSIDPSLENPS